MADFDWGGLLGSAIGAGASLYSANQGKKAAQNAYGQQQAAASQASNAYSPYAQAGQNALSLLNNEDITKLPGYQGGLDAGLGAINRNAAARGLANSGNRLKALTKYGIDYNTQQTSQRQNQLMQLINSGQNAAGNQAGIYAGLGNAGGASSIAQSNSSMGGLEGALGLASKYLTSKGSNGNSNGTNLWNSASSLFGGSTPSSSYASNFDPNFDYWA